MDFTDKVVNYKGSLIQHGGYNDRIYLMKLASVPSKNHPYELINLAKQNNYSKIFAKVPDKHKQMFLDAGFLEEACIPKFYSGKETAAFLGYYLTAERLIEKELETIESITSIALNKEQDDNIQSRSKIRLCGAEDVEELVDIYKNIFATYPFPIHEPEYILETIKSNVEYFGIEVDGKLVAVSSAELDKDSSNVEMTDFATLNAHRGHGYAKYLLDAMNMEMKKKNIKTAYTIARAMSPGMNITFSKAGYTFGGRLKNNTNISGEIESMNVWYKTLDN